MSKVSTAIDLIISWLAKSLACLLDLVKSGQADKAGLLILDIQDVISKHLLAVKAFIPEKPIGKVPGNFFAKIAWVLKNSAYLNILAALAIDFDPFEEAKLTAKSVAMKWGFYNEVYGG